MSKIFFIADTHFGDKNVFEMSGEKKFFASVKEKDNTIIERWNEAVTPEDTVFILGDFGDMNYWYHLNGKKILIKGNHDNERYCDIIYPIIYENFFIGVRLMLLEILSRWWVRLISLIRNLTRKAVMLFRICLCSRRE